VSYYSVDFVSKISAINQIVKIADKPDIFEKEN